MKHKVFLGLGSNLGDGRKNLDEAVRMIAETIGEVVAVSTYIESEPWGFRSANRFTNGAVAVLTTMEPIALLNETQRIERVMGRTHKHKPGEPYTDRVIDIDILMYDQLEMQTDRLTIPHPLIEQRDFVKIPLSEIQNEFSN